MGSESHKCNTTASPISSHPYISGGNEWRESLFAVCYRGPRANRKSVSIIPIQNIILPTKRPLGRAEFVRQLLGSLLPHHQHWLLGDLMFSNFIQKNGWSFFGFFSSQQLEAQKTFKRGKAKILVWKKMGILTFNGSLNGSFKICWLFDFKPSLRKCLRCYGAWLCH